MPENAGLKRAKLEAKMHQKKQILKITNNKLNLKNGFKKCQKANNSL